MSKIVLGIGTSHSPLLTFGVDTWIEKAADDRKRKLSLSDGRTLTYDQLQAEVGVRYEEACKREVLAEQYTRCQQGLDRIADAIEAAAPDIVVIIGDDQGELFSLANMPAVSIFYGDTVVTHPWGEVEEDMPRWKREAATGYGMDVVHHYRAAPELASDVIRGLIERGVDIGAAGNVEDPKLAGFGHAYGFVAERLFRGRDIPILPVLLNTYFPPNVPTAARCFDIGSMLRDVLENVGDYRVAVVASGGLSHFVTDEALDRGVIDAFIAKDAASARGVPGCALRSGSSEILNWIMAAGALDALPVQWWDYVPVYRTPAGSGVGMGFMIWQRE